MLYHGYTIRIEQDPEPMSPEEYGVDEVFLTGEHRQFSVERPGFMLRDLADARRLKAVKKAYYLFPLIAYIHSGVALSLTRGYPFDCPWDSGQVGFVFVKKIEGEEAVTRETAERNAEYLVQSWNRYLSGDVWGFIIEDADGEMVDSCWGFEGYEYAVEQAKEVVEGLPYQLVLFDEEAD